MSQVVITNQGIRRELNNISMEEAVAEYIWNGFDPDVTVVNLSFETEGPFGHITKLVVENNGRGIDHRQLNTKFRPFLEFKKQANERTEYLQW